MFLHFSTHGLPKLRSFASRDSRGRRLSPRGLWNGLRALSCGAEETLAFEMQNNLLRRFLGR